MEVTRIFDLLEHRMKYFPNNYTFGAKENGNWIKYTSAQYKTIVDNLCYGLLQLGIKKGDKVVTITPNRPEWNFVDMAIMKVGAIHVPVYPTISLNDYKHILSHSEVRLVFVSGWELLRKIEGILDEIPTLSGNEMVYTFKNLRGYRHLNEIIELGQANPSPQYLQEISASIQPTDVCTMIYTSGTTGVSKGVMLTHRNILSNVQGVCPIPPISKQGQVLSYLPLCHMYERMLNYLWQYLGYTVYYTENLATIVDNLQEIKPDIFSSVPRLLEKVYDKICSAAQKQFRIKRTLFFLALHVAKQYEFGKQTLFYRIRLRVARRLVLYNIKKVLGGNLKIIVSGGAAFQPKIARVFEASGIHVLVGYGLTETSPVIAVHNLYYKGQKFETVGQILPTCSVKIADDNEILMKGQGLMVGYYKDEEQTHEAIDNEGWFHTGDIGYVDEDNHLHLTGRKKEMFKTAFGKYVVPTVIERILESSEFIDAAMVVGENQKFAAALIVPDFVKLRLWCESHNIEYSTNAEMMNSPEVQKRFKKEVANCNKQLGETEQIKRFHLMDYTFSIATGELTPTLKLRRAFIANKHKDKIDALFA